MNGHSSGIVILARQVVRCFGCALSIGLASWVDCTYADENDVTQHSDIEYHLDKVIVESSPLQDTLFNSTQSVSVLSGADLDEQARNSLGDTLAHQPGVTSSSFGPGAGRPIIRGVGGDRVRILENGVSTQDVSSVSPDHPTTIESSLVDKIEVVRGPAALLYGTSAIGGVVNTFDKRIAEKLPTKPVSGTMEMRADSVDQTRSGVFGLDAPAGPIVFHVDGFKRRSGDIGIPGFARTADLRDSEPLDYPEPKGRLPWSDTDNSNLTLGSSYVFSKGFVGAAVSEYDTRYGVPNGEPDVSIDATRRRVDVRAGVRDVGDVIESVIARAGLVSYDHTEYQRSDPGTRFNQDSFDSRLDVTHKEIHSLRGTWGVQVQGATFEAIGEEAFQPPTDTGIYSAFGLEELLVRDDLTWQLGGRLDWNNTSTTGFEAGGTDNFNVDQTTLSQSTGVVWDVTPDYAAALSVAHTERAPTGQELFADGPHIATGAYEIGDQNLGIERSIGTDLTLRKKEGVVRGFIGGFFNRYWNYISLNPTGAEEDNLPVYTFQAVNADFIGFESQVALFVRDRAGEELSFDIQPDYVWARDRNNDEYLPRIPPFRLQIGSTYYNKDICRIRLEAQQVFSQRNTADYETSTDSYTMLNLYVTKELPSIMRNLEVFARGTNLLSEKARNHTSFIKDVAPLPGASAMVGLRIRF